MVAGGTRGKQKLVLVLVEGAKCAAGSLDELSHPQTLGEQCGQMAGKREQAFGAQMELGLQGLVDVSHVRADDV